MEFTKEPAISRHRREAAIVDVGPMSSFSRAACVGIVGLLATTAVAPATAEDGGWSRYLATTCTSCHLADGTSAGIPSIVGWNQDDFANALRAYRTGERDHLVMHNVALQLDEEDVRQLADYFASLDAAD